MSARKGIFILITLAALGYGFFVARGVLFPISLKIISPRDGAVISGSRIEVVGKTEPSQEVWIGGKIVTSDEAGDFFAELFLFPGYNEIGISAVNRFGKETRRTLRLFAQ